MIWMTGSHSHENHSSHQMDRKELDGLGYLMDTAATKLMDIFEDLYWYLSRMYLNGILL